MAEKPELNAEEKMALAKELYSRGSRNYLVKDYYESADDLSKACELYAEIHGNYGDELAMPYMLYAKALIALAQQGENKLLTVPEEDEEEDDQDQDQDPDQVEDNTANKNNENAEEEDKEKKEHKNSEESEKKEQTKSENNAKEVSETTKIDKDDETPAGSSKTTDQTDLSLPKEVEDINTDANEEENDDDSPTENLQIAWEVLEMAVQIFTRQGEASLANLADAYFELAEISLENSNFEAAITDFKKSLEIRMKLNTNDLRIIAEIHYKIGLNYLMLGSYGEAVTSLKEANRALDCEIESQKEKEPQTDDIDKQIKEIEELKQEIGIKIQEIEEAKEESMVEVKKELSKLISTEPLSTDSSGLSSLNITEENKPKPTDISYLIKRKKPADSNSSFENGSPAKKPAL